MDKEIAELKSFIADLKADREAQKLKEKSEAWTKYTSMSLVFIAVLAAIATQWAGKYSSRTLVSLNDSTFQQALATDEWSYYQAKSIKQNLYEALREIKTTGEGVETADTLKAFNAKIAKYEVDKKDVKEKAEGLEKKRDDARAAAMKSSEKGGGMGMAVAIFQIAIALGSICLVTKKRPLWYVALALSVVATAKMVQVWMN
jgi:hypothetical protein